MLTKTQIEPYLKPLSPIPTPLQPQSNIDKKFQCILFDLYGTLFISDAGDIQGLKVDQEKLETIDKLLSKYKIKKECLGILEEYVDTISNHQSSLLKKGIEQPEIQIDKIWSEILSLPKESVLNFSTEFELIINPVVPMPNLEAVITSCRHSTAVMGIISNAQFYTNYLFHWFLGNTPVSLGFHKKLIFYSYMYGHAKPSPHMFHNALNRLIKMGIRSDAVLFVGNDMRNDILSAKKVGFKTALFAGDARSLNLRNDDPECNLTKPDIILTDLIQLTNYMV